MKHARYYWLLVAEGRPATPGKRIEVAQLAKRQRNVAAIANDVNKERFGNLLLDGRQPATVSGL